MLELSDWFTASLAVLLIDGPAVAVGILLGVGDLTTVKLLNIGNGDRVGRRRRGKTGGAEGAALEAGAAVSMAVGITLITGFIVGL